MHGACIGAGVELPAFAARVVAHPDTTFTLPELAFGLVPGAGGTASLPPRIGRQRTAQLALTAEPIDAADRAGVGSGRPPQRLSTVPRRSTTRTCSARRLGEGLGERGVEQAEVGRRAGGDPSGAPPGSSSGREEALEGGPGGEPLGRRRGPRPWACVGRRRPSMARHGRRRRTARRCRSRRGCRRRSARRRARGTAGRRRRRRRGSRRRARPRTGLGHDGEAERGEVVEHLVGHDGAVLDAVAGRRAGLVPGGEGEHQRRPGARSARRPPAPVVGGAIAADHVVEGRELVVGEHDLRRPDRVQSASVGGRRQRRAAGDGDVLGQRPAADGGGDRLERRRRRSTGVASVTPVTPKRAEPPADRGEVGRRPPARGRAATRRARRSVRWAHPAASTLDTAGQLAAVGDPDRPASAAALRIQPCPERCCTRHGPVGHERRRAVLGRGRRRPTRGTRRRAATHRAASARVGGAQRVGERPAIRRPPAARTPTDVRAAAERQQVEVVVVQPGDQGAAAGVDDVLGGGPAGAARPRRCVRRPTTTSTPTTVDLGVADRPGARSRRAIGSRRARRPCRGRAAPPGRRRDGPVARRPRRPTPSSARVPSARRRAPGRRRAATDRRRAGGRRRRRRRAARWPGRRPRRRRTAGAAAVRRHEPTGDGGVVAEAGAHVVGRAAAVGGDRQPHAWPARPATAPGVDAELGEGARPRSTRSPRRRRRRARRGRRCPTVRRDRASTDALPALSRSKNAGRPAAGRRRGGAVDSTLTTSIAGLGEQLPAQRPGPQRRQVDDPQRRAASTPVAARGPARWRSRHVRRRGVRRARRRPGRARRRRRRASPAARAGSRSRRSDHGVVAVAVDADPRRQEVEVVASRQRHGQPSVGGGSSRVDPPQLTRPRTGEAGDRRPLTEQGRSVDDGRTGRCPPSRAQSLRRGLRHVRRLPTGAPSGWSRRRRATSRHCRPRWADPAGRHRRSTWREVHGVRG